MLEYWLEEMTKVEGEAPYWTQLRLELRQWFRERVPGFADGYEAAVRLVHDPTFPARVHLVSHLVRDIYAELPKALGDTSNKQKGSSVYSSLAANLREEWDSNPVLEEDAPSKSDRLVSAQTYAAAARLVEASRALTSQGSFGMRLARALSRAVERPPDMPLPGWSFKAFDDEYDFFVARAHLRGSTVPWDDDVQTHFESFERTFHSIVGPYFKGKEELDAILADTNRRTD